MSRRVTLVTIALTAVVAFLVGVIAAGGVARSTVLAVPTTNAADLHTVSQTSSSAPTALVPTFADVVARINSAVVNIDATAKGAETRGSLGRRDRDDVPGLPGQLEGPFGPAPRRDFGVPRRGTGSGFIIDADGSILTNNHVIERAERITVKLADGRVVRARVIGADSDTDIALIKVD